MLTKRLAAGGAAIGLAATTACGVAGAAQTTQDVHQIDDPVRSVEVNSDSGDVEVVAVDRPGVRVTEKLRYSGDRRPETKRDLDGDRLKIGYRCPGRWVNIDTCSVGYRVEVPEDLLLKVDADSGSISVSGLRAISGEKPIDLAAGSGDITVRGLGGNLVANADSGTIRAQDVRGRAKLVTGSGDIVVDGLAGDLNADADSGSVKVGGLSGRRARVKAGAGDVRLAFTVRPDNIDVDADSGSVRLALPDGPYAVNTDTDSGTENVEVPTDPSSPNKVKVVVGSGDADIVSGG